jgi:large subunit ribosomal protein L25
MDITGEVRTELGTRNCRRLRAEGFIPCVLYSKGVSQSIKIKSRDFLKVQRTGEKILDLVHPSGKDKVLIKDIQYDHLMENILHIDFYKVAMDEVITVEVPVHLTGTPKGVTEEGGVLDQYIKEVKVSCLPRDIPQAISADVSAMKIGDLVHLKDLVPPTGVKCIQDPELVIAAVNLHKIEEAAPAPVEITPTEPEVIKKEPKKEEIEEEEEKKEKEKPSSEKKPS